MDTPINSADQAWLAAKNSFDDGHYEDALTIFPSLIEKLIKDNLYTQTIDSWLKTIYCYVILGNLDLANTIFQKYSSIISRISNKHLIIGQALILSLETVEPTPLLKAVEHFSQAWRGYRYSEFPKLFQKFEQKLIELNPSLQEPTNDYSITSYTLWIDGLDLLAEKKYILAFESLSKSFERYKYAELLGDAAWSWYDTVVCCLFLDRLDQAQAFYKEHLYLARSISSRFVIAADYMLAAYQNKEVSCIENAMHIIAHMWYGYQESQYPQIFLNFEQKLFPTTQTNGDYSISAYALWLNGLELASMSFLKQAIFELEKAEKLYSRIKLKDAVAWVIFSVAITYISAGKIDTATQYIATNISRLKVGGNNVMQAIYLLLDAIKTKNLELLDKSINIWSQSFDLEVVDGVLALEEKLKSSLSPDANYTRNSTNSKGRDNLWSAKQKGLRVELSIEQDSQAEELYRISLVNPSSVIQSKPISKKISAPELENILNSLTKLALRVDGVRRGLQIDLPKEELEKLSSPKKASLLEEFEELGKVMYYLLLPKSVRDIFKDMEDQTNIILKVDDRLICYPWEIMFDSCTHLCLKHNISRVISSNKFYSKPINRPPKEKLRFLIIGDPLENDSKMSLPNARAEAISIAESSSKIDGVEVKLLIGEQATTTKVLSELSSGYDLFHFSGHVIYDSNSINSESAILLANREVAASTIKSFIEDLPPLLVFINACESGKEHIWDEQPIDYENRVFGIASAFLSAGCYYIGSIWPIYDNPAILFAQKLYQSFFSEFKTLGCSVREARLEVREQFGERDVGWASYIFYGDPILTLSR